jgi:hypothetical protein
MPPTATASALNRALNSAAATALARLVVLSLPLLTTVGLWAGHRYLAEQVASAPVVLDLGREQIRADAALLAQAERIRALEEATRVNDNSLRAVAAQLDRIDNRLAAQSSQLNRMVGAFEARGLIPPRPDATLTP